MMATRSSRLRRALCAALALFTWLAAQAQAPADEARQAERIRAERAAADAVYERKVQECAALFAVTSCVDAARAERHAVQVRLDREQQVIDDAKRQRRAAERQRGIDSKLAGEESAKRESAARARSQARPAASAPAKAAPAPASGASSAARSAKPQPDAALRAEQEARARRAYELKLLQAEAHRREVEQRNAERARKANPGAPLPLPAASAGASAPR